MLCNVHTYIMYVYHVIIMRRVIFVIVVHRDDEYPYVIQPTRRRSLRQCRQYGAIDVASISSHVLTLL